MAAGVLAVLPSCQSVPGAQDPLAPDISAHPSQVPEEEAPAVEPEVAKPLLDQVQGGVSRAVKVGATWVDSFLGNDRALAEDNDSWVRIRLDNFVDDQEGLDVGIKASGRLVLPQTEDRVHVVFTGADDGDPELENLAEADDFEEASGEEDESRSAGLQYFVKASKRNNLRADVGVSFKDQNIDPYVGMRWRHTVPIDAWALRASEQLRLYAGVGFESRTTVDLERPLGEQWLFRSSVGAKWYQEEPGAKYDQAVTLYQRLSDRRLLSYEARSSITSDPEYALDKAILRLRYSQRLMRDWILLEIAPQVAWREEYDYAPSWGLLVRIDFEFGRQR